jgi:hypothetical protein
VTQAERELNVDDEFEEDEIGVGHGLWTIITWRECVALHPQTNPIKRIVSTLRPNPD